MKKIAIIGTVRCNQVDMEGFETLAHHLVLNLEQGV